MANVDVNEVWENQRFYGIGWYVARQAFVDHAMMHHARMYELTACKGPSYVHLTITVQGVLALC